MTGAEWTPTQTEQDLAASLRLTAGQVTRARAHVQARVQDLEQQALQMQRDASALVTQQRLVPAGGCLLEAARMETTARELRRVLDLLQ